LQWTKECRAALEELISQVCDNPELNAPDPSCQYKLKVDASQFTLGAVLFQKDNHRKRQAIGFASKMLNEAEQNYNVWDREFTTLVFGLKQWRHHLAHTEIPVIVYSDHTNLAYYWHPQKINQRVARGINMLSQYNFQIIHKPGVQNCADALSQCPDYPTGQDDNKGIIALPNTLFIKAIYVSEIHGEILSTQEHQASVIMVITEQYGLTSENHLWTHKG
jgi:hypothetical protein